MKNKYHGGLMQQNNADRIERLQKRYDLRVHGRDLSALVPIMESLFREQRLSGDTQRDMAQAIEYFIGLYDDGGAA